MNENEWREKLSPREYEVLREKGTERAFSGRYDSEKRAGIYACAGCGQALFDSETKFDSGTGWPSFHAPVEAGALREEADHSGGATRTEVMCRTCGGHLGHVFPDGPEPTGLRYCMNSASLKFEAREGEAPAEPS